MSYETAIRLVSGLLLLLANAFFVAAEFALTRLRQYPAGEFEGDGLLERAWEMTEQLEIYLTSCQIGITSTSILLGVVAEPAVTVLINSLIPAAEIGGFSSHTISIVLSIILINFVHTVWGEQTPTYLGVERAKGVARYCALPLKWWTYAIYPLLYFGDWITKATLRLFGIRMKRSWVEEEGASEATVQTQIVDLLKRKGLPEERRNEVVNALEIDEVPVRDIMVPEEEIVYLYSDRSLKDNLAIVQNNMRSRYPLMEESSGEFIGVLYTAELLGNVMELQQDRLTLEELSWADSRVADDMPVSDLIDFFQHHHQELALVTSEQRTVGLVTLTDALEAIVGHAEDPTDLKARLGGDHAAATETGEE
ncbi:CNNM domain-containing protein [Fodinibius sediminis]|uniref:Hemolysin, contains CBS domains n=1 Tax=Fodinibius sediminis TaxID=1214077 RepID=A0A521BPV9_9BACT|nr:CNNM domain-containing protein [Fodinibius sediminis]SMO49184.1 Hemolysin, contains CBS domains [Fodinibius sediminis]